LATIASTSVWGEVGAKVWVGGGVADCGSGVGSPVDCHKDGRSPAGGGVGPPLPYMLAMDSLALVANWANFCESGTRT
jgi:hypothetical protein